MLAGVRMEIRRGAREPGGGLQDPARGDCRERAASLALAKALGGEGQARGGREEGKWGSGRGERSRDLSIPLAALGNEEEREMGSSEGGARGKDKGIEGMGSPGARLGLDGPGGRPSREGGAALERPAAGP